MLYNFLILPIWAAQDAVKSNPKLLNVISVETTNIVDTSLCLNHLHLPVYDYDDDCLEKIKKEPKCSDYLKDPFRAASKEDILNAVEFSKKYKVHIIHCAAGLSRSPAIAYSIFRGWGLNKKQAMERVIELAPASLPNKRIVRLTDEIFGEK